MSESTSLQAKLFTDPMYLSTLVGLDTLLSRNTANAAGRPSIAVMPFTNLSADPEQKYFADGLAEDLIAGLSRTVGLQVIARHSSFALRDAVLGIQQIANTLGVQFLVEGSVRRAADKVRISVQLADARSNTPIWTDRFDGGLGDIFALQDEVVAKILTALSGVLPKTSDGVQRRAPNLEAYDLFVRGRLLSLQSPEENCSARPLLERAIALDPDFAEAHAWLAMNLNFGWMYCYEADCRTRVQALAERAIVLDPRNADAHVVLGYVLVFNGKAELENASKEFRTALSINPSHADAWMFTADLEVLEGKPEDALRCMEQAFTLNPHPPQYYLWLKSWIYYAACRYEDIVIMADQDHPEAIGFQRNLAAALAQLGRTDEARAVAAKFLERVPQFTINSWIKTLPFRNENDAGRFVAGYEKAGFPR